MEKELLSITPEQYEKAIDQEFMKRMYGLVMEQMPIVYNNYVNGNQSSEK